MGDMLVDDELFDGIVVQLHGQHAFYTIRIYTEKTMTNTNFSGETSIKR